MSPPRVTFYLLEAPTAAAWQTFVCRLAYKIRSLDLAVHIRTGHPALNRTLDELLWTFDDRAFLPHSTDPRDTENTGLTLHPELPPELRPELPPGQSCAALINLGDGIADWFVRFERIAEVVSAEPSAKQAARERYRQYQERGYPLEHHQIPA